MSEAPERIWIDRGPKGGWMKRFERMPDSEHEYTRTDLAQSQIDAAVSAEREACARLVGSMFAPGSEEEVTCDVAADAILARGDTDALAERDAQVRAEALREAASLSWLCFHKCDQEIDVVTADDILALIPKKEDA